MDEENNGENWPLSNYPIFIALVLGVGIRFLEFTVPENMRSRVAKGIERFWKKVWGTLL